MFVEGPCESPRPSGEEAAGGGGSHPVRGSLGPCRAPLLPGHHDWGHMSVPTLLASLFGPQSGTGQGAGVVEAMLTPGKAESEGERKERLDTQSSRKTERSRERRGDWA